MNDSHAEERCRHAICLPWNVFPPRSYRFIWPCVVLLSCDGTPAPEPTVPLPDPGPVYHAPVDVGLVADTLPHMIDSAGPTPSEVPQPVPPPEADEGCVEHIDASPAGVRVVQYASKAGMKAREAELEGTLASAWMMAEQGASVSIADDFERGISTEHTDMPDTLDVTITYYARCSSRSPHTVRAYRVWRAAEGGYGWRVR